MGFLPRAVGLLVMQLIIVAPPTQLIIVIGPAKAVHLVIHVGAGQTFATIQECAGVAVAGNVCEVHAGTYSETVTPANSGTPGLPITFRAFAGDVVTLSGGFLISNRAHITVSGFRINNPTSWGVAANTGAHFAIIQNNDIQAPTSDCIRFASNGTSHDVTIRSNTIHNCGVNGVSFFNALGVSPGDRLVIEANEIYDLESSDALYIGGNDVVVRNNFIHDYTTLTGFHMDALQISGQPFTNALIEGNVIRNCTDVTGNCHAVILRNVTAPASDQIIFRHNYMQNLDGPYYLSIGGAGDEARHVYIYNNTSAGGAAADELFSTSGIGAAFTNTTNGVAKNNILFNRAGSVSFAPWVGATVSNGNLAFTAGLSGNWAATYSAESTYAALHDQNPLFTNYPTDVTLQAGSPALAAGVSLTTVAVADTGLGTTLVVEDAHYFQPGWAGVNADWIRIGAATTAQISAINYDTNTITLVTGVSRSDGDPVYLYRNSSGTVVLTGIAPNVGSGQN